jgi:predicted NACHT family NTPase
MKEFSDTRFVVTSRPNGYLSNPIDGVTVLDVKPFTWPQVEHFAKNWYLATETVGAGKRDTGVEMEAEAGAQDLFTRLGANPALTDLAVNPLLLTMITTVHKERNSLPGRRVELYQEICDVFLGKRRASKGLPLDLTPAQKKRVLQPLAWHMMEQNLRVIGIPGAEAQIAPVLALVDPNVKLADFFTSVREDSGLMIEREKANTRLRTLRSRNSSRPFTPGRKAWRRSWSSK